MRRLPQLCLGILSVAIASGSAIAGPALDDDKAASPAPDTTPEPGVTEAPVEYGVGIRLRNVRIPKAELELFLENATGSSNVGFGIDLTRRRGNVELQLGFEYEQLQPAEGVWIESGKNVAAGDEADFIVSPEHALNGDKLGWFTIEFTFLNHAKITKNLAFRYGGGAGLGLVTGSLQHYNIICAAGTSNSAPEPGCKPPESPFNGTGTRSGGTGLEKYDLPPVFPVVNAIIGLQYKPTDKITVNLETGIRTFLFFGTSASYFF